MDTSSLLKGLRFVDSFFPSGGYAFSSGLEAAVQGGAVRNAEELSRYVVESLTTGIGEREAVAVGVAHDACVSGILEIALKADQELEAMKLGRESRTASRQMGRQTLRVAAALTGEARLVRYAADVDGGLAPGHHAVAYGLAASALGWAPEEAATAYLYSTTALLVGAALRLLSMGQMEGQRVLWGLHAVIERVARESAARDAGDLWSFAPGIELALDPPSEPQCRRGAHRSPRTAVRTSLSYALVDEGLKQATA